MPTAQLDTDMPVTLQAASIGRVVVVLAGRLVTSYVAKQLTRYSLTLRLGKFVIDAGHSDDSLARQRRIDADRERGRVLYRDWQVSANGAGTIIVGVAPMWLADP